MNSLLRAGNDNLSSSFFFVFPIRVHSFSEVFLSFPDTLGFWFRFLKSNFGLDRKMGKPKISKITHHNLLFLGGQKSATEIINKSGINNNKIDLA